MPSRYITASLRRTCWDNGRQFGKELFSEDGIKYVPSQVVNLPCTDCNQQYGLYDTPPFDSIIGRFRSWRAYSDDRQEMSKLFPSREDYTYYHGANAPLWLCIPAHLSQLLKLHLVLWSPSRWVQYGLPTRSESVYKVSCVLRSNLSPQTNQRTYRHLRHTSHRGRWTILSFQLRKTLDCW